MNTGHDGAMSTIHANDTRDAMGRLEMLIGMAAPELPMHFIHRQIASAINIVVQVTRLPNGERKITQISEVTGMHGESLNMHDVFQFQQLGLNCEGAVDGQFIATGIVPECHANFEAQGLNVSRTIFTEGSCPVERIDCVGGL